MIGLTKPYAAASAPSFRVNFFVPEFMNTESTLSYFDWMDSRRERMLTQTKMKGATLPGELTAALFWLATDDVYNMAGSSILCYGGTQDDRRMA